MRTEPRREAQTGDRLEVISIQLAVARMVQGVGEEGKKGWPRIDPGRSRRW